LSALLRASSGEVVATGVGDLVVAAGASALAVLHFDGRSIFVAGRNGPFTVDALFGSVVRASYESIERGAYVPAPTSTSGLAAAGFQAAPYVFGLVVNGGPVVGARVSLSGAANGSRTDELGAFRVSSENFEPGEYVARLELPAGVDTSGWRCLLAGVEVGPGREQDIELPAAGAIRVDFVRGAATDVSPLPIGGKLLVAGRLAPSPVSLDQPFQLSYVLAEPAYVRVTTFDVRGRVVERRSEGLHPAGPGSLVWNSTTASRVRMRPGVYLVRVEVTGISGRTAEWNGRITIVR
jgi:hypothetical protein